MTTAATRLDEHEHRPQCQCQQAAPRHRPRSVLAPIGASSHSAGRTSPHEIDACVNLLLGWPLASATRRSMSSHLPIAAGKREATKLANRAAIVAAAREVFAEIGFGAASVRDIIRRTDLATGTFYNYFPDKESVLVEILDETAAEIRVRVRAARRGAATIEDFVRSGFEAYFRFLAEDPLTLDLLRRNAGTIRAMFDEPSVGAGTEELRDDLEAGSPPGCSRRTTAA